MRTVAVAVVLAVALAGCAGPAGDASAPPRGPTPAASADGGHAAASLAPRPVAPALEASARALPRPAAAPAAGPACVAGEAVRMRTAATAYAAVALRPTAVFGRPGGERLARFGLENENGYRTVFGVLGAVLDARCEPAWYRVQLPLRPNGVVGFVHSRDVELVEVRTRIEIDLSERRLDFFEDGRLVLTTPAAIGAPITPTPTGSYYVNQRLTAPDPWGPFGPAAIGISAFSPVLQDWVQGGPVAIHGTNEPETIGEPVSHGCVRIANDVLVRIFERSLAGTPVEIRA